MNKVKFSSESSSYRRTWAVRWKRRAPMKGPKGRRVAPHRQVSRQRLQRWGRPASRERCQEHAPCRPPPAESWAASRAPPDQRAAGGSRGPTGPRRPARQAERAAVNNNSTRVRVQVRQVAQWLDGCAVDRDNKRETRTSTSSSSGPVGRPFFFWYLTNTSTPETRRKQTVHTWAQATKTDRSCQSQNASLHCTVD